MGQDRARKIVVLGSTGSIGTSTLDVVRSMPDRLQIVGLSAGCRWELLAQQIREFGPRAAALAEPEHGSRLQKAVADADVELMFGPQGACELAALPEADIVVSAIMGWAGLLPAIKTLECGHVLALANKESLVVGGEIVQEVVRRHKGTILPVDSEQSAVLQAMRSGRREEVARVVITASGGPFRGVPRHELDDVTPEQALRHPTWRMGKKVTIDSATMMNKALEIIETRWLFDLDPDQIETVIHPQSIVHSMVEFVDGSVVAQLGVPDMKLPIQFALTYPDRVAGPVKRLDLARVGSLELLEADPAQFPALRLGYEVARRGGTSGTVLNAADEVAVEAFLNRKIRFSDIVPLVATVLEKHEVRERPDLAELKRADRWAREEALRCSGQL